MNTATMLHHTAMEFYDLAGIYKAKGRPEFFDDYRRKAWLLEKEAALQMLAEQVDFTFKYLVIISAGKLGYDIGEYKEAKQLLELGLLTNPPEVWEHEMTELLTEIVHEIGTQQPKFPQKGLTISGTLTSADIENNKIKIRQDGKKQLASISASTEMIKKVIRFYLGELVTIQLDKDGSGRVYLKSIGRFL